MSPYHHGRLRCFNSTVMEAAPSAAFDQLYEEHHDGQMMLPAWAA